MTESDRQDIQGAGATGPNVSEPVSREQLYEMVWKLPMLRIAEQFGVSSSYMARVCTELRVPRPPRDYWAQLEVGRAPERPALPVARPGDMVSWSVGSTVGSRPTSGAFTHRDTTSDQMPRLRRSPAAAPHELVASARPLFLKTRDVHDDGLLRPFKRLLVDVVVSEATLDAALDAANRLFKAIEDGGHRVTFAPANSRMRRAEFDVREVPPRTDYYPRPWSPDRPTVAYVGTMPIGLTLFEMTEQVEVVYVKGDYLPVRGLSAEQLRRYKEPYHWRSQRQVASGRLCLQAYSTHWRVGWTRQWRESKAGQLTSLVPQVVEELERAAPELAARVAEAEAKAEAERIAWEAQRQREREEAERARRAKTFVDARKDLLSAIDVWDEAERIRAYFAAAQSAILAMPEADRLVMTDRLDKARAVLGNDDPLSLLRKWRAPEER